MQVLEKNQSSRSSHGDSMVSSLVGQQTCVLQVRVLHKLCLASQKSTFAFLLSAKNTLCLEKCTILSNPGKDKHYFNSRTKHLQTTFLNLIVVCC